MSPKIGITCSYNEAENYLYLRAYYIEKIIQAGGVPLVLPINGDTRVIKDYVDACDGFLLAGGGDIDPVYWGQEPEPGLGPIDPRRDNFELQLMKFILEKDIPALGICRGAQVINVACGGSIIQDLKGGLCHMQKAPKSCPFHDIVVKRDTRLCKITGNDIIRVNSFHHQAVGRLGRDILVSAAARDGVIEAIESQQHRFLLGVQWHPECMTDAVSERLFTYLVEAAGKTERP